MSSNPFEPRQVIYYNKLYENELLTGVKVRVADSYRPGKPCHQRLQDGSLLLDFYWPNIFNSSFTRDPLPTQQAFRSWDIAREVMQDDSIFEFMANVEIVPFLGVQLSDERLLLTHKLLYWYDYYDDNLEHLI